MREEGPMKLWTVWVVSVLFLSAGCASHQSRCDGRLEPINPPTASPDASRDVSNSHRPGSP
jgi:hypothetical protein